MKKILKRYTMIKEIAFTKVKLPYGWLGNMAAFPIIYNNKNYRTTEALFQALRFLKNPEIQELIRLEKSPMSSKMFAKSKKDLMDEGILSIKTEKLRPSGRGC